MKKYYCIDCKKEINESAKYRGTKRCNSCAQKERFKFSKSWNYKGLKHICIDCGQQISKTSYYYGNKRCKSCSCKGELNNFYGKVHNIKTRKKMSKIKIIYEMGREPYSLEFNDYLKQQIRKRDRYTCQNFECNMTEEGHLNVYGQVLHVHHIDYNKQNCDESNLITLCGACNIRANSNRDYWFAYFTYILEGHHGNI